MHVRMCIADEAEGAGEEQTYAKEVPRVIY